MIYIRNLIWNLSNYSTKVKLINRFDLIDYRGSISRSLYLYKWEVWIRYKLFHELIPRF
jgi:hypothetical protein